jgi:predicted PurR-regulated permease PerM
MTKDFKSYFFLLIFAVVIGLNIYLLKPLLHTLIFASIITSVYFPLYHFLIRKKEMAKKWAALICTFSIMLTIFLPSTYMMTQLSKESITIYNNIRTDLNQELIKSYFVGDGVVALTLEHALDTFNSDMSKDDFYKMLIEKARGYLGYFVQLFKSLVANTFNLIFQFFIMLLISYALFLSGDGLKEYFFKLSPLPREQEQKILDNYNQMNFVTLVGNGVGGVIQGLLAGIAFWIVGIPSVFLWTTFMIILAFIPLLGMSIVFIPACIYLFIIGKTMSAIILLLWCGSVAFVVENIFKPKFIGDRLKVDGILLLLYIIAGMSVFGVMGLFYGPLLCIIFLTVSEIFTSYYLQEA